MFFPAAGPKVSLGGRSSHGASRDDVLKRTKLEREKRRLEREKNQAATRVQAFWRAYVCRKRLNEEWRQSFHKCFSSSIGDDVLSSTNPLLPLFHRIFRSDCPDDVPILKTISEAMIVAISRKGQTPGDLNRTSFYAAKISSAILHTLEAQRDELGPVLVTPLGTGHMRTQTRLASAMIQNLIALTSDATWESWRSGRISCPVHSIIQTLAAESLFRCISRLLAITTVYIRCNAGSRLAVEMLTLHLLSAYRRSVHACSDQALSHHAPWLLLAVPDVLQCSSAMLEQCTALMPMILSSLRQMSPADLKGKIFAAARLLSCVTRTACEDVTLCCLHMLSALTHGICSSERLTACHVVSCCRTTRLLVALLPRVARMQLAAVLIDMSGQEQGSLQILVADCFGGDPMDKDEDADNAFTQNAVWFLPRCTVADSCSSDAPPPGAPKEVAFPTPLAATRAVAAQLHACVEDASCSAAEGVREMTLWLYTLLSLSQSDPLLSEKVATAWANAPCQLIRSIWRHGLRAHMRDDVLDNATAANPETSLWHPEQPVQSWMVPLMTLSAVYSQYVSTAPDDALFADQAPIPLGELVPRAGRREAGEFIPFLREALYLVVFAGQQGGGKVPPNPDVSRPFKLLTGRLFGQLHSRAARRPDISDTSFQARDLQHARFLRDVKLALGLADLFGEDPSDDGIEARLKSAYVEVLKYAPGMARFDDRAMVFQELVHRDRSNNVSQQVMPHGNLVATIRRDHVFEDSLQLMSDLASMDLKNRLRISFIDVLGQPEPGIDGGGLFKDFIENLLKEAFHPDLGMFLQTEDGAMGPNPAAQLPPGLQTTRSIADAFRLLGSMLGKAMYEGIIVELPLAAFFLKKLRGGSSDLNDLPSLDRQLYGNMMKLTDPSLDLESVGVHFTIISTASGVERDVPLMPGGEHVAVTRENLPLYLTLVADYRLNREIAVHAAAFMDGFMKLIEPAWLRMFNDRELQQLISGDSRGGFDLDDFKDNVHLGGGYHAGHNIIRMFWRVLAQLDKQQQSAFLKFVTACSRPPLLGFKYMQPPIAINMRGHVGTASDESALPTASTCFNLLKLPPYQDEQTMLQKLLLAIEGAQTFDLS
eukprot:jgi/Ulvmu1/4442/UM002_0167.1